MTQTSRSEVTEYPPTVLSPHDLARLRRLFGGMPYMHGLSARLDPRYCQTVGDLINILEKFQENVVYAATRAQETEVELSELHHTLQGGGKLLAMLQGMAKESA